MRYAVIFNPAAGGGRSSAALEVIEKALTSSGAEYSVFKTTAPGEATGFALRAAREGYECVLTVGGDGTINETVNGLMQVDVASRPLLGVLPAGTGNDFTRILHHPLDPETCLRQLLKGRQADVDVWNVNGEYFVNVVGLGLNVDMAAWAVKLKKVLTGMPAYIISVLLTLITVKFKRVRITADGRVMDREIIVATFTNGDQYGGGIKVAPGGSPVSGKLMMVCISKLPRIKMIPSLVKYIKGQHYSIPQCEHFEVSEVLIEPEDASTLMEHDGEIVVKSPAHITNAGKIRVLVTDGFDY